MDASLTEKPDAANPNNGKALSPNDYTPQVLFSSRKAPRYHWQSEKMDHAGAALTPKRMPVETKLCLPTSFRAPYIHCPVGTNA